MKHSITFTLMLILALVLLAGCSPAEDDIPDQAVEVSEFNYTDEYSDLLQEVSDSTFSLTPNAGAGTLTYTVENSYLVDNMFDAGISMDELNVDAWVSIGKGSDKKEYGYPDYGFVDSNTGQLIDGAYLIAVELTVTNVDAFTERYTDRNTLPLGATPDPNSDEKAYVFDANYLYLYDSSRARDNGERTYGDFAWFTGYGQREESVFEFYLPPGEATTMTIYYLIGEYDGDTLSSLGLTHEYPFGHTPETIYPLILDDAK
ncbi:MAG: hypothetical protein ACI3XJ_02415 [Oscillospiraceae bacterium]